MTQYEVNIDLGNPNTSHTQVADLVGGQKRVLDVGCATGDLGRVLQDRGCEVTGVEMDAEAAAVARGHLVEVHEADLERTRLTDLVPHATFDAIVFADVLEHLTDPVATLADAAALLAPGGQVVVSLPNVTHGSIRLALLQGRWEYTPTGLLDRTHVRFFSRKGFLELVRDAGFVVEDLRGTIADPLGVEVDVDGHALPAAVVEWVRGQQDALVYQFVAALRPARTDEEGSPTPHLGLVPAADPEAVRHRDEHTQAFAADLDERRRVLTVRDHVIGLEATASVAHATAETARKQARRLARDNRRQHEHIRKLERTVGRLRRRVADLEGKASSARVKAVARRVLQR